MNSYIVEELILLGLAGIITGGRIYVRVHASRKRRAS